MFNLIAALFFPPQCLACKRSLREGVLCTPCRGTIAVSRALYCGQCGRELRRGGSEFRRGGNAFCHPQFPYILGSAGSYENVALKALIHALKFRGARGAAEPLASLLVKYVLDMRILLRGMVVVPIPLSRERVRSRGFNQSEYIARSFSELLELPIETGWLARVKHTKPQSETTSLAERRENVQGCFAITDAIVAADVIVTAAIVADAAAANTAGARAIRGKNIILIDDVSTSGATFLEAARVLKSAGAAEILALAVAKA